MSRSKKSRKPGSGSIGIVKDDKKKLVAPVPRKPKNKSGKQPGNRQKEAMQVQTPSTNSNINKDPRIGNKTPIVLGTPAVAPKKTKAAKKPAVASPIAAIRVVDTGESLSEQLANIEQDTRLLEIIEKQDNEVTLTDDDVNYYNELMEKHQKLSDALGIDDEEPVENTTRESNSEEQLWDKFNNADLSEFE
jgi:ribosome assembly protein YihI (activator of Der GTPase)